MLCHFYDFEYEFGTEEKRDTDKSMFKCNYIAFDKIVHQGIICPQQINFTIGIQKIHIQTLIPHDMYWLKSNPLADNKIDLSQNNFFQQRIKQCLFDSVGKLEMQLISQQSYINVCV